MTLVLTILTNREIFLLIIGSITYVALFVVAVQNSRHKMLQLQERLNKVHLMQEQQQSISEQQIALNRQKMDELESLIRKLGDENSMLRLELEEKRALLDYNNKVAIIESEKRQQAETVIFSSEAYRQLQELLNKGKPMDSSNWSALAEVVNSVYTGFTEKLYSLYRMSEQDYHVSLLIKMRVQPKDIAALTAHSKESIASTRSRLYQKVFGRKGSSKDWDDFVLSL